MNHEDDGKDEPTRFAWHRDGLLVAGTLSDWAKMWEGDYYAGEDDLTAKLWWWPHPAGAPGRVTVSVHKGQMSEDDMIPYLITVPGLPDVVSVSIDGRA